MKATEFQADVRIPLFPDSHLYLFVGRNARDMRREQALMFGEVPGDAVDTRCWSCWNRPIWVPPDPPSLRMCYGIFLPNHCLTAGEIWHEIFHVTMRVWEHHNHHPSPSGHEPHAYLGQWIADWVHDQLHVYSEKPGL